jgi:hypothetical protein
MGKHVLSGPLPRISLASCETSQLSEEQVSFQVRILPGPQEQPFPLPSSLSPGSLPACHFFFFFFGHDGTPTFTASSLDLGPKDRRPAPTLGGMLGEKGGGGDQLPKEKYRKGQ